MKLFFVILLLIFISSLAQAQDGENNISAVENISYGYADVLRVDPVYEYRITREPREECYSTLAQEVEQQPGSAAEGAATGSGSDENSGREVTRGSEAAERSSGQRCRIVEIEREDRRIVAYDVEYRYRGEIFLSRLNNDPGDHLRIRITITPEE